MGSTGLAERSIAARAARARGAAWALAGLLWLPVACGDGGTPPELRAPAAPRGPMQAEGDAPDLPAPDTDPGATVASGTNARAATLDAGFADAAPLEGAPRARSDLRCQPAPSIAQHVDYAQPGPHVVGILELLLEDTSRPIEATDKHPAAPSRLLPTRVYYPASAPPPLLGNAPLAAGAPFPMLMYSHGFSSSREESNRVGRHAASHGYVLVAPDYPLTNINANAGMPDIEDVANQPGDVAFLIDHLLALSDDHDHTLFGAVDATRIGALGVSLGGLTTLLLGYHGELSEPRIAALAPVAAPAFFFTERFYDTRDLPLLLIHGDLDAFVDYGINARRALERAAPSARLMSVARGSHTGFGAPVDGALLGLVQPLFAPPDAHPMNPDGLGCGYVANDLANTEPDFLDALGGPELGIEASAEDSAAALPCMGDEYTMPALDLDRQMTLLATAVVAFFDAHLGDPPARAAGCDYLLGELAQQPEVVIE